MDNLILDKTWIQGLLLSWLPNCEISSRSSGNVHPVGWRMCGVCFPWPWVFEFCIWYVKGYVYFSNLRWILVLAVTTEVWSAKLMLKQFYLGPS